MLLFALLVMLACVLNFDRSTVKPALLNTQNDCHQGLSHSWGSLQRFPTPFSWFKGDATSKEKGRGEGTQIPGSTPDQQHTDMKTRDSHTS